MKLKVFDLIMTDQVQALSYAAIILAEGGKDMTADNLNALLSQAGMKVDAFVLECFAKAAGALPVKDMVNDFGSAPVGGAAAPAAAEGAAAAAAEPEAEEEEEEEESSVAAGGMFGGSSSSEDDSDSDSDGSS